MTEKMMMIEITKDHAKSFHLIFNIPEIVQQIRYQRISKLHQQPTLKIL